MINEMKITAFGPMASRHLGKSLEINNIPPKICTYLLYLLSIYKNKQYSG